MHFSVGRSARDSSRLAVDQSVALSGRRDLSNWINALSAWTVNPFHPPIICLAPLWASNVVLYPDIITHHQFVLHANCAFALSLPIATADSLSCCSSHGCTLHKVIVHHTILLFQGHRQIQTCFWIQSAHAACYLPSETTRDSISNNVITWSIAVCNVPSVLRLSSTRNHETTVATGQIIRMTINLTVAVMISICRKPTVEASAHLEYQV